MVVCGLWVVCDMGEGINWGLGVMWVVSRKAVRRLGWGGSGLGLGWYCYCLVAGSSSGIFLSLYDTHERIWYAIIGCSGGHLYC